MSDMKLCSKNHEQVVFESDTCPCCDKDTDHKKGLQDANDRHTKEIQALGAEIAALARHLPPRHFRKYEGDGQRPKDVGLYELVVDCRVVHGMHNSVYADEFCPKGFRFNFLGMVGDWIAVTPVFKSTAPLFSRIGDSVEYVKIDAHNRKLK